MPEIHRVASTGSTNDDAKAGARAGAAHGTVWVAEEQTAGRGRQGRTWIAPPGSSLLFSVLHRVSCPPARVPPLALVTGLAVRDAVAKQLPHRDVMVKWPNDVQIAGKKIAGVLVESAVAGMRVEYVVIGIGVNVFTPSFPPDLVATSLALESADGAAPDRELLLQDILAGLDRDIPLVADRGLASIHARLLAADALRDAEIVGDDGLLGIAEGIDTDGRLLVRTDGILRRISSGEVSFRRR